MNLGGFDERRQKTSVLAEASDFLALHQVTHAAIDLDALGLAHIASQDINGVVYRNLQCACKNHAALGVERVLLARALEDRAELELCGTFVSAKHTIICRLTARIDTMEQCVRIRESGIVQRDFVARVAELNGILERARLERWRISG